ncbi:MAG TPA: putative peptide maturation dehydrogenase [Rhodanobacteraceae bacterium]|nr:putative peptide maturation dehydrogenase [Rhodanobacteraceae bacterium]
MQVRRCAMVLVEPRESIDFDLAELALGETGVRERLGWLALAAHCDEEIPLDPAEVAALGALSPGHWQSLDELSQRHPRVVLEALLAKGLLIAQELADESSQRFAQADDAVRTVHWRGLSAIAHRHTRWRDVDTEEAERLFSETSPQTFLERLGPALPVVPERAPAASRLPLEQPSPSPLDALMDRRVTCRNYDPAPLSFDAFSAALYRAFGARAVSDYAPGVQLLKKGVPSAGGVHATEAYLLVQRVERVPPGLYHYHPVVHALEPLREMDAETAASLARRFVAAQAYYAGAPLQIALVSRFERNFWKYRNHAKAYRAVILDAGHLSQAMYLAATELNLGAFITAAINEVEIEQAFGLEPMAEGPLAVCGFGVRAQERVTVEFDPAHKVWDDA